MKNIKYLFVTLCLSLFSSGLTSAQHVITIESYRESVLNYSKDLKIANEQLTADQEELKIARKLFYPNLSLDANTSLDLSDHNSMNDPESSYRPYTYSVLAKISQPVYVGGVLNAKKGIANIQKDINEYNIDYSTDRVYYQADNYYWNLSKVKAQLNAAIDYKNIVRVEYETVKARFDDGKISKTDLLMIATRMQEAELLYVQTMQQYTIAIQNFNIVRGHGAIAKLEGNLLPIESDIQGFNLMQLDEVLSRRADYKIAEAKLELMNYNKKEALSNYNPSVGAFLSAGWATASPNTSSDVRFSPIVGLNLSIPVFHWCERTNVKTKYDTFIKIENLSKEKLIDEISIDLQNAVTSINETEKQLVIADSNFKIAIENLDLMIFSYNEGKNSIVDVLSALESWLKADNNIINANYNNKMAIVEYNFIISKEFE